MPSMFAYLPFSRWWTLCELNCLMSCNSITISIRIVHMTRVADLIACLERLSPLSLAEEWDNTGLLVGDRRRPVQRVLTCLTLTADVAREAISDKVSLVVAHHPVPFRPVSRLTADDPQGQMLLELITARVAVYSPHTAY